MYVPSIQRMYIILLMSVLMEKVLPAKIVESSPKSPNILLIIIDDLRPNLGSYGDHFAMTPNIDLIANEGVVFTKAFAQQALCGPSRTSFLTSRRPHTTKVVDVHHYWRVQSGNFTTMPQYFKENGYVTASVGKVFHPGICSNFTDDAEYSWSEKPYHPSTQKHRQDPVCLGSDLRLHTNIYCPVDVSEQPEGTLPDIQIKNYAVNWLRERHKEKKVFNEESSKPFFLAVGFHKPHIPLKFPRKFLDLYPLSSVKLAENENLPFGLPQVAFNPWNDLRRRDDIRNLNLTYPYEPIPHYYARYIRQGYYAATSYVDSLVGEVTSMAKKLFPNTIVALIADHGWSLGEHQEWSKFSNFEVATNVPFIIALPDNPNTRSPHKRDKYNHINKTSKEFQDAMKKRYNGIVELIDLFPTLVDLTGLPALSSCPNNSTNVEICTEGTSLSCIIHSLYNQRITNPSRPNNTKSKKLNGNSENDLHLRKNLSDNNLLAGRSNRSTICKSPTWPFLLPDHSPQKEEINQGMRKQYRQDHRKNLSLLSQGNNAYTGYSYEQLPSCECHMLKNFALSQYPRPGVKPSIHPDSDQPRLKETEVMGYSISTGKFRYAVWVGFDHLSFQPNWTDVFGEELYDHSTDPEENHNVVRNFKRRAHVLLKEMRIRLGF